MFEVGTLGTTALNRAPHNFAGVPVTFTTTLASIAGPPPDGETVQFVVNGKVYGSATLKGGVAQFTTSAIPAGSRVVVAKYKGNANYLSAWSSVMQTVNP